MKSRPIPAHRASPFTERQIRILDDAIGILLLAAAPVELSARTLHQNSRLIPGFENLQIDHVLWRLYTLTTEGVLQKDTNSENLTFYTISPTGGDHPAMASIALTYVQLKIARIFKK